ncbi:hypothetical protein Hanom_Chr05g00404371 [Helianthus anomalus]
MTSFLQLLLIVNFFYHLFTFLYSYYLKKRVKCNFSPCSLDYFDSLVQRFHFLPVNPKKFHCCHFSPLD